MRACEPCKPASPASSCFSDVLHGERWLSTLFLRRISFICLPLSVPKPCFTTFFSSSPQSTVHDASLDDTRPTSFFLFLFAKRTHKRKDTARHVSSTPLTYLPLSRQGAQCCSVWFSFGIFSLGCFFLIFRFCTYFFFTFFIYLILLSPYLVLLIYPREPRQDLTVCCSFGTKSQRPSVCEVDKVRRSF